MRIHAAIDLRDGAAVQLVGGDPAAERVRLPDPVEVARGWLDLGFRSIHVVDLDAALDRGENGAAIAALARAVRGRGSLQVGGGLREDAAIERVLALGADRAVVGTRAVEDAAWLQTAAARFPGRLVVAADVRGTEVLRRGWTEGTDRDAAGFLATLDPLPLAAVLVTDVDREGRQAGADIDRFRTLAAATRHPLIAAGGITTPADLHALAAAGIHGAVLGMALYSGRLDPAAALDEETE